MTQEQSTRSARRVHTPMPTKSQKQRAARRRWVVALVLALAGLAAPFSAAQAQTEIWSATMTAGTYTFNNNTFYGWDFLDEYTGDSLSDEDFIYREQQYKLFRISVGSGTLRLTFSGTSIGSGDIGTKATRDKLTFHASDMAFKVSDGMYGDSTKRITWANSGLTWAANDMVALQMTTTDPGRRRSRRRPGPRRSR